MKLIVLALACLAVLASAQINCQSNDLVVDDFSIFRGSNSSSGFDKLELVQGVDTTTVATNPITGAARSFLFKANTFPPPPGAIDHILGGFRDVIVYIDQQSSPRPSPGQGVRTNINVGPDSTGTVRPQFRYSTDQGVVGIAEVQWDGNTDSANPQVFVKTGLGGVDLTLAGASDSFTLNLESTDLPILLRVEAWSYAGGNSANSRGVYFEWDPSAQSSQEFRFSQFLPVGAAVDPTSVFQSLGAMRFFISRQPNSPPEIDLVIYSVSISNRYCLLKAAARGTAGTLTDRFNLFIGANNRIIASNNCANAPVSAGTRVTFIVQAYIENVDASTLTILDNIDSRFALIPSSVEVYTHNTPSNQLTASIVSTSNNRLEVRINVLANDVTSYVTVFFEVNVLATGVNTTTCNVVVPNRATLATGAISINSFNFNGQTATDAPTRICITAAPALTIAQTTSATDEIKPGDSFTITTSYRNTGQITANSVLLTATLASGISLANTAGWSNPSAGVYTMSLGALPVEASARTMVGTFVASEDAEEGDYTVRCCISTVGASLPTYCQVQACATITVHVKPQGHPQVKILKRGHLVRQLIYDVDFYNPCADAATDVVVTEIVPAGTHFNADESDERWRCNGGVCTLVVGNVPSNGSGCGEFVVDIDPSTPPCTVFQNYAVVTATNDIDLSNNDDSATIIEPGCPANDCIDECLESFP